MKESRYKIKSELNTTIALITDTHNRKAEVALQSLQRVAPDLIAVAGDFVLGHRPQLRGSLLNCSMVEHQKNVLPFLSSCVAIAPTYVSLGNHEAFLREDDLEMIRATGVVLLDNTFVRANGNRNRKSRQRLDRHGTIVVGSCETSHHYNVQGCEVNDEQ